MTKQTLAALAALLAFMAVLVAVPLATSDTAEAHTKTVKRCSYDPFTNVQQCWTETVAHTHRVIPDNPPPDTSPTTTTTTPPNCPAGTTGTPPNCSPIPPTNDPAPDPEDKECPAGTVGTPPNCKTQPPPECPAGQTGTWPNCKTPPKTCPAGQHSNGGAGKNCHSHSFTPPHCGTGTWSPGHGHTPVPLKPCPPPDTTTTTAPPPQVPHHASCLVTTGQAVTARKQLKQNGKVIATCATVQCFTATHHLHDNQGTCHGSRDNHCADGLHQHVHGSSNCHALGQRTQNAEWNHSGWTDHCPAGQHSHEHTGSCHVAAEYECPDLYVYSADTKKCELETGLKIFQRGTNLYVASTGQVLCTHAGGGLVKKAANKILKEVNDFSKWLVGADRGP